MKIFTDDFKKGFYNNFLVPIGIFTIFIIWRSIGVGVENLFYEFPIIPELIVVFLICGVTLLFIIGHFQDKKKKLKEDSKKTDKETEEI